MPPVTDSATGDRLDRAGIMANLDHERKLVLSEPQCNVQMLRLLSRSENSLHHCRKQATAPAPLLPRSFQAPSKLLLSSMHEVHQPSAVTPGLQRTPSPAVIAVMVNPVRAPYSATAVGNSCSVVSAIRDGPAPDSAAATL